MGKKRERDLIADRAESFTKQRSTFAPRNVAVVSLFVLLIGGYFALKAAPATSQDGVIIPETSELGGAGHTGIFEGFEPLAPVDTGPSELELQMQKMMGAIDALGARVDQLADRPMPEFQDRSGELTPQIEALAQRNEELRQSLELALEQEKQRQRAARQERARLDSEIAALRAQVAAVPASATTGEITELQLAEAEHRREMERAEMEARLDAQRRLAEFRLEALRETREYDREKELKAIEADLLQSSEDREFDRELELKALEARYSLQEETARISAEERARLAALSAEEREQARADAAAAAELEKQRRESAGIVFDRTASLGIPAAQGADPRLLNDDSRFLAGAADTGVETARAVQLQNVERLVPQGTLIPGVMDTAIQSDLPGGIRATVTDDVWSADGTTVLIPQGSKLIGEYRSDIRVGQSRVLVAWNRAITPDHRSVQLGSTGTDALGRAGQTGYVDNHFPLKFEAASLISIVTAATNYGTTVVLTPPGFEEGLQSGTNTISDASNTVLEEYLSIPPTIHVDQGSPISVFVQRDLYL